MDVFLGIPVGFALSAAAGLRVFVPLLLTGAAARLGYLDLAPGMAWIGSGMALLAFATATAVEVAAYYVPWLDNALDALAAPAAVIAGVVATAAVPPSCRPWCAGHWLSSPAAGRRGWCRWARRCSG